MDGITDAVGTIANNLAAPFEGITLDQPVSEAIQGIDLSKYADVMNPSTWSTTSVESFIVIILLLIICYKLLNKALRFGMWCIGLIFLVQIFYCFGQTALNNIIPFSEIFKYDVGMGIVDLFKGTKVSEFILWAHDMTCVGAMYAGNLFAEGIPKLFNIANELKGSGAVDLTTVPTMPKIH